MYHNYKKNLLLFSMMLFAFVISAQNDKKIQSISLSKTKVDKVLLPKKEMPKVVLPNYDFSKGISTEAPITSPYSPKEKQNSLQPEKFLNPYELPKNLLGKGGAKEDTKVFRRHQFLGEIKTKTAMVRIVYRDHMAEDGDMIKIMVNDIIVKTDITLYNYGQQFQLGLTNGFNKIEFEALNQGTSGPNTASFQIFDEKGNLLASNQWDLATGFRATFMIIRE